MRVLLVFLGLVLLVGGAVAVYRFLDEDTRAFDDARRADVEASDNLDRGRPDPRNVVEPGDVRRGGSGAPDGTAYWVRDETGGFRMSTTPGPRRARQPFARQADVTVTIRNEGPATTKPLVYLRITYRDFYEDLVPFSASADWTQHPLAVGESRVFESQIPSGTTPFKIQWSDTSGLYGFSRDDAGFSAPSPGSVTWTLDRSNCYAVDPSERIDYSEPFLRNPRTYYVAILTVVAAVWIVRRRRRALRSRTSG